MSDLPSCEDAADMLNGKLGEIEGARIVAAVLRAVVSGRYVDREAIDYKAAALELYQLSHEPNRPDTVDAARLIVDAAIRDTT